MKHNIVVLNDASKIDEVGTAALKAENNVPDHPSIIAASDMIGPGESTELVVNIPNEPGIYPYMHIPWTLSGNERRNYRRSNLVQLNRRMVN